MRRAAILVLMIYLSSFAIALAATDEPPAPSTDEPPVLVAPKEGFNIFPANPNAIDVYRLIYELRPGDTIKDAVRVKNTGDKAANFEFYATDGYISEKNQLLFFTREEIENSPNIALWTTIETPFITLSSGEESIVNFEINIPPDTPYGEYEGGIAMSKTKPSTYPGILISTRSIQKVDITVTDDPEKIPMANQASIFLPTEYFWASVAIFLGSMGYLVYANKRDERS